MNAQLSYILILRIRTEFLFVCLFVGVNPIVCEPINFRCRSFNSGKRVHFMCNLMKKKYEHWIVHLIKL